MGKKTKPKPNQNQKKKKKSPTVIFRFLLSFLVNFEYLSYCEGEIGQHNDASIFVFKCNKESKKGGKNYCMNNISI